MGELQRVFEVAQTVAATLDVEDVRAVEQAVEDGGGQDFVAGEQPGPVADALVSGDEHGAAAVAVTDQAEEQAGLLAGHRLVYVFIDAGRLTNADTGLVNGTILALGTFTSGGIPTGGWC